MKRENGFSPLSVVALSHSYGNEQILNEVSLELPKGKMSCILGPNGAGKSTLLKCALGLEQSSKGKVLAWGKPLHKVHQLIAYVPQDQAIDRTVPCRVKDFVLSGRACLLPFYLPYRKIDYQKTKEVLARFGLEDLAERPLDTLSLGQFRRTLLARAFAQEPMLYLLDEPLAGLDHQSEQHLIHFLRQEVHVGKTVLAVHHDLQTVEPYFDWAIVLKRSIHYVGPTNNAKLSETLKSFV